MARFAPAVAAMVVVFGLAAPQARANTYLFSVSVGDVLSALATNSSDESNANSSFVFAVNLQPQGVGAFSYCGVALGPCPTQPGETAPNGTSPGDPWSTATVSDPSDLGAGSWAQFSKGTTQAEVAVISNATVFGSEVYQFTTYSDRLTAPYGWGSTSGQILEYLPTTDALQFVISTSSTLSGNYTVAGVAYAGVPTGSLGGSDPKTERITFSLTGTAVAVPEPETWGFVLAGVVCFLFAGTLSRRRTAKTRPAAR